MRDRKARNEYHDLREPILARVQEKKEALFHERAECDSRYTSCEHGIAMSEYVSDYDAELEEFKARLEAAVETFIARFEK